MNTPAPMTDEQREWIVETCPTPAHIIDAVEATVNAKWVAMLGEPCDHIVDANKMVDAEPATHQYQARDGSWQPFVNGKHYDDTKADGTWPIRALFTHPAPLRELSDGEIKKYICRQVSKEEEQQFVAFARAVLRKAGGV